MRCTLYPDLDAFAPVALPFLLRDPVRGNQIGTAITSRVLTEPGTVRAVVTGDDGDVAGVATLWPPRSLLVSALPADGVDCLVETLTAAGVELPGVDGLAPGAGLVAAGWAARHGGTARQTMAMGLHALPRGEPVHTPAGVPGVLVRAGQDDRDLVTDWLVGFDVDAHPVESTRGGAAAMATYAARALDHGEAWLWRVDGADGAVASMVLSHPVTGGVARVSGVYTPPELRRRGYAGACVAALTSRLFADGVDSCALYTDLANPTSNGVYRRIGYRQVAEAESWRFS